jgi:hypothetical protein
MKVYLATPMYGGCAHGGYVCGVATLFAMCAVRNIDITLQYMTHESLITRARNMLVKWFLDDPTNTHLLFIDADIEFKADDILKLLELDKDVIGMPYAKKELNWNYIQQQSVERNGRMSEELFKKIGLSYILSCLPGQDQSQPILEVQELGTGLLMIKREVIERMIKAYADSYAISDDMTRYNPNDIESRKYWLLFDTMLNMENRRYLSEDYAFCKKWRDIGGKIYIYTPVQTVHHGTYRYEYDSSVIKLQ